MPTVRRYNIALCSEMQDVRGGNPEYMCTSRRRRRRRQFEKKNRQRLKKPLRTSFVRDACYIRNYVYEIVCTSYTTHYRTYSRHEKQNTRHFVNRFAVFCIAATVCDCEGN